MPQLRTILIAVEAAAELARASAELRLARSDTLVRRLGTLGGAAALTEVRDDQVRAARRVGAVVARVARRLPWHPTCLRQALVTQRMLRRRGIAATLHLGVTSPPAVEAHAWVTVNGSPVVGQAGLDALAPLAAFR